MSKEKNLVEDALIQMRNLEEAVAENAKGILASTMKQEIKELVKESIVSERDDDDEEIVDEPETGDEDFEFPEEGGDEDFEFPEDGDNDDEDSDFSDIEDEDSYMSSTGMMPDDDDDDVIDLTGVDDNGDPLITDKDLLKVFLAMSEDDGIIVKKDNNMVNLKDDNTDKEYMIQMESDDFMGMMGGYEEENESMDVDDEFTEDEDDTYESYEFTEDEDEDGEFDNPMGQNNPMSQKNLDELIDSVFSKDSSFNKKPSYGMSDESEEEEVVYEIEMGDEDTYNVDLDEMDDIDEDDAEEEGFQMESMKPKIGKGARIGKPKFSYKKPSGGFKETMKTGTKGVGMGKGPKFEFKEGEMGGDRPMRGGSNPMSGRKNPLMKNGKSSPVFHGGASKEETKEASRTYGFGSEKGRGLRKGITPNRNLTFEREQKYEEQIKVLREKNDEYRKALNVFRDKLNEVATFNSNLAYATRLFTEHSTSKQEKINILRRFDGVESLKESKNLYRTIKTELTSTNKTSITESIEGRIEKTPSSGSASTLIESKTYENPQFLRMKDIMSKIIK